MVRLDVGCSRESRLDVFEKILGCVNGLNVRMGIGYFAVSTLSKKTEQTA